MTTKERVPRAIRDMPDNASLEEIRTRIEQLKGGSGRKAVVESGKTAPVEGAWDSLRNAAGAVEMPADWASEHDHYLYGLPKRSSTA